MLELTASQAVSMAIGTSEEEPAERRIFFEKSGQSSEMASPSHDSASSAQLPRCCTDTLFLGKKRNYRQFLYRPCDNSPGQ